MFRYLIRRLLYLIPLFFGILIIVFVATRIAGDPVQLMTTMNPRITAEAKQLLTEYYDLDRPIYEQFFRFILQLIQGDLGNAYAIRGGIPVTTLIGDYAWLTFQLQLAALVLSLIIAIPIGIISAKKQYSKLEPVKSFVNCSGFLAQKSLKAKIFNGPLTSLKLVGKCRNVSGIL